MVGWELELMLLLLLLEDETPVLVGVVALLLGVVPLIQESSLEPRTEIGAGKKSSLPS